MPETDPFEAMRLALAPRGTTPIVNLTAGLASPHFDSGLVRAAIDTADARVRSVAETPDLTEPLSPLETLAIQMLMRASGQD